MSWKHVVVMGSKNKVSNLRKDKVFNLRISHINSYQFVGADGKNKKVFNLRIKHTISYRFVGIYI